MKQLLTLVVLLVPLTAAADAPTPAARAKASIEAQLVTFQRGLAGEPAFLALFEPDGVIVADRAVMTAATIAAGMAQPYRAADHDSFEVHSLLARLFGASGDGKTDRTIKKLKLGKVTAGGVADAVWFTFDLDVVSWSTTRYRISELLVNRGGWKLAAAHIAVPQPDSWEPDEESEGDGPQDWGAFPDHPDGDAGDLAALAVLPKVLASSLAKNPVVFGTSARDVAIGNAAASKLLRGWGKLKLEYLDSLEVVTGTWGYAVVQVNLPGKAGFSMKMRATIVGVPRPGGGWQVVVAQYSRVRW